MEIVTGQSCRRILTKIKTRAKQDQKYPQSSFVHHNRLELHQPRLAIFVE